MTAAPPDPATNVTGDWVELSASSAPVEILGDPLNVEFINGEDGLVVASDTAYQVMTQTGAFGSTFRAPFVMTPVRTLDVTPPIITLSPTALVLRTQATLEAALNERGTLYWSVYLRSNAGTPSPGQVAAGLSPAIASGRVEVSEEEVDDFVELVVDGLAPATAYIVWISADDNPIGGPGVGRPVACPAIGSTPTDIEPCAPRNLVLQSGMKSRTIDTQDDRPPKFINPWTVAFGAGAFDMSVAIDEAGKVTFLVLEGGHCPVDALTGATRPTPPAYNLTVDDVRRVIYPTGSGLAASGSWIAPRANVPVVTPVTATDNTTYSVYMYAEDEVFPDPNVQAETTCWEVVTPDLTPPVWTLVAATPPGRTSLVAEVQVDEPATVYWMLARGCAELRVDVDVATALRRVARKEEGWTAGEVLVDPADAVAWGSAEASTGPLAPLVQTASTDAEVLPAPGFPILLEASREYVWLAVAADLSLAENLSALKVVPAATLDDSVNAPVPCAAANVAGSGYVFEVGGTTVKWTFELPEPVSLWHSVLPAGDPAPATGTLVETLTSSGLECTSADADAGGCTDAVCDDRLWVGDTLGLGSSSPERYLAPVDDGAGGTVAWPATSPAGVFTGMIEASGLSEGREYRIHVAMRDFATPTPNQRTLTTADCEITLFWTRDETPPILTLEAEIQADERFTLRFKITGDPSALVRWVFTNTNNPAPTQETVWDTTTVWDPATHFTGEQRVTAPDVWFEHRGCGADPNVTWTLYAVAEEDVANQRIRPDGPNRSDLKSVVAVNVNEMPHKYTVIDNTASCTASFLTEAVAPRLSLADGPGYTVGSIGLVGLSGPEGMSGGADSNRRERAAVVRAAIEVLPSPDVVSVGVNVALDPDPTCDPVADPAACGRVVLAEGADGGDIGLAPPASVVAFLQTTTVSLDVDVTPLISVRYVVRDASGRAAWDHEWVGAALLRVDPGSCGYLPEAGDQTEFKCKSGDGGGHGGVDPDTGRLLDQPVGGLPDDEGVGTCRVILSRDQGIAIADAADDSGVVGCEWTIVLVPDSPANVEIVSGVFQVQIAPIPDWTPVDTSGVRAQFPSRPLAPGETFDVVITAQTHGRALQMWSVPLLYDTDYLEFEGFGDVGGCLDDSRPCTGTVPWDQVYQTKIDTVTIGAVNYGLVAANSGLRTSSIVSSTELGRVGYLVEDSDVWIWSPRFRVVDDPPTSQKYDAVLVGHTDLFPVVITGDDTAGRRFNSRSVGRVDDSRGGAQTSFFLRVRAAFGPVGLYAWSPTPVLANTAVLDGTAVTASVLARSVSSDPAAPDTWAIWSPNGSECSTTAITVLSVNPVTCTVTVDDQRTAGSLGARVTVVFQAQTGPAAGSDLEAHVDFIVYFPTASEGLTSALRVVLGSDELTPLVDTSACQVGESPYASTTLAVLADFAAGGDVVRNVDVTDRVNVSLAPATKFELAWTKRSVQALSAGTTIVKAVGSETAAVPPKGETSLAAVTEAACLGGLELGAVVALSTAVVQTDWTTDASLGEVDGFAVVELQGAIRHEGVLGQAHLRAYLIDDAGARSDVTYLDGMTFAVEPPVSGDTLIEVVSPGLDASLRGPVLRGLPGKVYGENDLCAYYVSGVLEVCGQNVLKTMMPVRIRPAEAKPGTESVWFVPFGDTCAEGSKVTAMSTSEPAPTLSKLLELRVCVTVQFSDSNVNRDVSTHPGITVTTPGTNITVEVVTQGTDKYWRLKNANISQGLDYETATVTVTMPTELTGNANPVDVEEDIDVFNPENARIVVRPAGTSVACAQAEVARDPVSIADKCSFSFGGALPTQQLKLSNGDDFYGLSKINCPDPAAPSDSYMSGSVWIRIQTGAEKFLDLTDLFKLEVDPTEGELKIVDDVQLVTPKALSLNIRAVQENQGNALNPAKPELSINTTGQEVKLVSQTPITLAEDYIEGKKGSTIVLDADVKVERTGGLPAGYGTIPLVLSPKVPLTLASSDFNVLTAGSITGEFVIMGNSPGAGLTAIETGGCGAATFDDLEVRVDLVPPTPGIDAGGLASDGDPQYGTVSVSNFFDVPVRLHVAPGERLISVAFNISLDPASLKLDTDPPCDAGDDAAVALWTCEANIDLNTVVVRSASTSTPPPTLVAGADGVVSLATLRLQAVGTPASNTEVKITDTVITLANGTTYDLGDPGQSSTAGFAEVLARRRTLATNPDAAPPLPAERRSTQAICPTPPLGDVNGDGTFDDDDIALVGTLRNRWVGPFNNQGNAATTSGTYFSEFARLAAEHRNEIGCTLNSVFVWTSPVNPTHVLTSHMLDQLDATREWRSYLQLEGAPETVGTDTGPNWAAERPDGTPFSKDGRGLGLPWDRLSDLRPGGEPALTLLSLVKRGRLSALLSAVDIVTDPDDLATVFRARFVGPDGVSPPANNNLRVTFEIALGATYGADQVDEPEIFSGTCLHEPCAVNEVGTISELPVRYSIVGVQDGTGSGVYEVRLRSKAKGANGTSALPLKGGSGFDVGVSVALGPESSSLALGGALNFWPWMGASVDGIRPGYARPPMGQSAVLGWAPYTVEQLPVVLAFQDGYPTLTNLDGREDDGSLLPGTNLGNLGGTTDHHTVAARVIPGAILPEGRTYQGRWWAALRPLHFQNGSRDEWELVPGKTDAAAEKAGVWDRAVDDNGNRVPVRALSGAGSSVDPMVYCDDDEPVQPGGLSDATSGQVTTGNFSYKYDPTDPDSFLVADLLPGRVYDVYLCLDVRDLQNGDGVEVNSLLGAVLGVKTVDTQAPSFLGASLTTISKTGVTPNTKIDATLKDTTTLTLPADAMGFDDFGDLRFGIKFETDEPAEISFAVVRRCADQNECPVASPNVERGGTQAVAVAANAMGDVMVLNFCVDTSWSTDYTSLTETGYCYSHCKKVASGGAVTVAKAPEHTFIWDTSPDDNAALLFLDDDSSTRDDDAAAVVGDLDTQAARNTWDPDNFDEQICLDGTGSLGWSTPFPQPCNEFVVYAVASDVIASPNTSDDRTFNGYKTACNAVSESVQPTGFSAWRKCNQQCEPAGCSDVPNVSSGLWKEVAAGTSVSTISPGAPLAFSFSVEAEQEAIIAGFKQTLANVKDSSEIELLFWDQAAQGSCNLPPAVPTLTTCVAPLTDGSCPVCRLTADTHVVGAGTSAVMLYTVQLINAPPAPPGTRDIYYGRALVERNLSCEQGVDRNDCKRIPLQGCGDATVANPYMLRSRIYSTAQYNFDGFFLQSNERSGEQTCLGVSDPSGNCV